MIIWKNTIRYKDGDEKTSESVVLGAPEIKIATASKLIPELKTIQTATPAFLEACMHLQISYGILGPGTGFVPITQEENAQEMKGLFFTVEFETYRSYASDFTSYTRERNRESVKIFKENIQPLHHQYLLDLQNVTKKHIILNMNENTQLKEEVEQITNKYKQQTKTASLPPI